MTELEKNRDFFFHKGIYAFGRVRLIQTKSGLFSVVLIMSAEGFYYVFNLYLSNANGKSFNLSRLR